VTITPDSKDWTWVLQRPCPECGFDARTFERERVGTMLRENAAEWAEVMRGENVAVRSRPDRWSTLEYGCHVRDVFRIYTYRLGLMLSHDDPAFPNWDQDETALAERYGEQDPAVVSAEIVEAAETLANAFDAVDGDQWSRTGRRSDGAIFTIETFARYFIHDPIHHINDTVVGAWQTSSGGRAVD
jgi:hypothetical protein